MANKERQKRSARQARAREREALEAAHEASTPTSGKGTSKATSSKKDDKALAKDKKQGFFAGIRTYFNDVRVEMHRVIWPSKAELRDYSFAVTVTLFVFGVVLWLVDTGIVALLAGFTSLRG